MTVFRIPAIATGGAFFVMEHRLAPGFGAPAHEHTHEDELSYVLDGRIGFHVGGEEGELEAGGWLLKPKHVPHAFWNAGSTVVRVLELAWPTAAEEFFRAAEKVVHTAGPEARASQAELMQRFGMIPRSELARALMAKFSYRPPA